MKFNILFIALIITQACIGQDALSKVDSVKVVIPKVALKFREITVSPSILLASTSYQISTTVGTDSIYVYQNNPNNTFLVIKNDSSVLKSNLNVPYPFNSEDLKFQYHFSFDSLGTNEQYLIVKWSRRSYVEHATYSGTQEFMCHQTVNKYETFERGLTIISLVSRETLFQGLIEIKKKKSQTKNPGQHQENLKNEEIIKAKYWTKESYLRLFNDGNESYNYWSLNKGLPFGIYQIIENQYALIKRK